MKKSSVSHFISLYYYSNRCCKYCLRKPHKFQVEQHLHLWFYMLEVWKSFCNNLKSFCSYFKKETKLQLYQLQNMYFLHTTWSLHCNITYSRGFGKALRCVGDIFLFWICLMLLSAGSCLQALRESSPWGCMWRPLSCSLTILSQVNHS